MCQLGGILSRDPALECTIRKAHPHNLFMRAMWTGPGQVADGRCVGHKHPGLGRVLVKLACTCLCCKWRNGMHPVIHETVIPSHRCGRILQYHQARMSINCREKNSGPVMDGRGRAFLYRQLLLDCVGGQAIQKFRGSNWCWTMRSQCGPAVFAAVRGC